MRRRAASANVAIAAATAFIALTAVLSFVDAYEEQGAGWRLRGTIAPGPAPNLAAQLPPAPKHV